MAKRNYFGTDGIRGVANSDLTPELCFKVAQAAVQVLSQEGEQPTVLIGADPRLSGPMLESALAAGFASAGCNVLLLGVVPTPAVAWLVQHYQVTLGVMISASHNPAPDNGIKFFNARGEKLSDSIELEIEKHMDSPLSQRPIGANIGEIRSVETGYTAPYLQHLKLIASDLKPAKIALDVAHGAMYQMAPAFFEALGFEVDLLHAAPDGLNINEKCGSTDMAVLSQRVQEGDHLCGIAFDGDGDRCLAVGPNGEPIDGDFFLYLCQQYLPELKEERSVVATVMSNLGLEKALEKSGVQLMRSQVGDRYVLEDMKAHGLKLGGEQSGHLIFAEQQVTGDGLLSAIQFLRAIQYAQKPLAELLKEVPSYPQILENVVVSSDAHRIWQENQALQEAIAKGKSSLAERGRILVRASGTEPKIRVMAEGIDPGEVRAVVDELVAVTRRELVC